MLGLTIRTRILITAISAVTLLSGSVVSLEQHSTSRAPSCCEHKTATVSSCCGAPSTTEDALGGRCAVNPVCSCASQPEAPEQQPLTALPCTGSTQLSPKLATAATLFDAPDWVPTDQIVSASFEKALRCPLTARQALATRCIWLI